jgi:hypothetical protein
MRRKILPMCTFTVLSLMPSRRAICLFARPWAASLSTCFSRSLSSGGGGSGPRAVASVIVGEAGWLGLAGRRHRNLVTERRIPGQPGDGGCGCDAPGDHYRQDQQQAFH